MSQLRNKYDHRKDQMGRLIRSEKVRDDHNEERVSKVDKNMEEMIRQHLKITEVAIPEPPPLPESDDEEEEEVAEAARADEARAAGRGPAAAATHSRAWLSTHPTGRCGQARRGRRRVESMAPGLRQP